MAKISYKQKTMKLTGMDKIQYQAAYDVFKHRVRRYNTIYGTNYSASKLFYEGQKYGGRSRAYQDILTTSSATTWKATEKAEMLKESPFAMERTKQLRTKFAKLIENSPSMEAWLKEWEARGGSADELKEKLYTYSEEIHRLQKESGYQFGTP